MADEKQHKNLQERQSYPEPEVPVDEAWGGMKNMLDAQLPPPPATRPGISIGGINPAWLLLLVASGLAIWIIATKHKPGKTNQIAHTVQHNTLQHTTNVAATKKAEMRPEEETGNTNTEAEANKAPSSEKAKAIADTTLSSTLENKISKENLQNDTITTNHYITKNVQESKNSEEEIEARSTTETDKSKNRFTIDRKASERSLPSKNQNAVNKHTGVEGSPAGNVVVNARTGMNRGKIDKAKHTRIVNMETQRSNATIRNKMMQQHGFLKKSSIAETLSEKEATKLDETTAITTNHANYNTRIKTVKQNVAGATGLPFKRYTHTEGLPVKTNSSLLEAYDQRIIFPERSRIVLNNLNSGKAAKKSKHLSAQNQNGFSYGLQWNIPLPVQGTTHLFTGTNARSQPYMLLAPGVWASITFKEKHEVLVRFTPHQWYFAGGKPIVKFTTFVYWPDSTDRPTTTKAYLNKTSSITGGLQYNYHITPKWSAGVGLQYNSQQRALVLKQMTDSANGAVLQDSLLIMNRATEPQYFKRSLSTGFLELSYRFRNVQVGSTLYLPLSRLSSFEAARPLNAAVFLRWRFR